MMLFMNKIDIFYLIIALKDITGEKVLLRYNRMHASISTRIAKLEQTV